MHRALPGPPARGDDLHCAELLPGRTRRTSRVTHPGLAWPGLASGAINRFDDPGRKSQPLKACRPQSTANTATCCTSVPDCSWSELAAAAACSTLDLLGQVALRDRRRNVDGFRERAGDAACDDPAKTDTHGKDRRAQSGQYQTALLRESALCFTSRSPTSGRASDFDNVAICVRLEIGESSARRPGRASEPDACSAYSLCRLPFKELKCDLNRRYVRGSVVLSLYEACESLLTLVNIC
ncbi:hypothetical protein QF002_002322 [Paraburkholderia youngii]